MFDLDFQKGYKKSEFKTHFKKTKNDLEKYNMTSAVVEYENLITTSFTDANKSGLRGGVVPRWKRKQMQASKQQVENSCSANSNNALSIGDSSSSNREPLGLHNSTSAGYCVGGDRFIPNRAAMNMDKCSHSLRSESSDDLSSLDADSATENEEYRSMLSSKILGMDDSSGPSSHRILSFKDKAPAPKGDTVNNLKVLYSSASSSSRRSKTGKIVSRSIPSEPRRILDAPHMLDEFYVNLL